MSQAGDVSATAGPVPPSVATRYDTNDANYAVPQASRLNVFGNNTASPANNGYQSYSTSQGAGTGKTVWINTYGTAKWVVNKTAGLGTHTTIASAMASATAGDTIVVTPGFYNEDFTFTGGVNLTSWSPNSLEVELLGMITFSTPGVYYISNVAIEGKFSLSSSSAISIFATNCYLNPISFSSMIDFNTSSVSANINFYNCNGNTNAATLFNGSGAGSIYFYECNVLNQTTTANSALSAGNVYLINSRFNQPFGSSGTNNFYAINTSISGQIPSGSNVTCLALASSGTNIVSNCILESFDQVAITSTGPAVVTVMDTKIKTSASNAMSGTGTINSAGVIYYGTGSTNFANTQVPLIQSNDAIKVVSPGGYPYATEAQDQLILVDTSAARTIVPLANPTTGQKHIIKDSVGSAAANNITVTPSGKNIDNEVSFIISTNWGSITMVYNGTQWNVV